MSWVRLDDQFADHPKVRQAGPLGLAMQVAALCYCNRYLTDGFLPRSVVPTLLNFEGVGMRIWRGELVGGGEDASWQLVVDDLLSAGLWEEADGGYLIHDYLDYQPSREEELALRATRAEAGRRGGQRSGETRRESKAEANHEANASAKTKQNRTPVPVPVPVPDPGSRPIDYRIESISMGPDTENSEPTEQEASDCETDSSNTEGRDLAGSYIGDIAGEFDDKASQQASTTRALNLWQKSGVDQKTFVAAVYNARTVTKQHYASISDRASRMPYFFACLETLLLGKPPGGDAVSGKPRGPGPNGRAKTGRGRSENHARGGDGVG